MGREGRRGRREKEKGRGKEKLRKTVFTFTETADREKGREKGGGGREGERRRGAEDSLEHGSPLSLSEEHWHSNHTVPDRLPYRDKYKLVPTPLTMPFQTSSLTCVVLC